MAVLSERLKAALSDRYEVERELGSGGMATVYLAKDLKHNRKVALKVLRPELAASIGAERFLREIEVTANLNHPHILPLHDSGAAEGFLYYVMPFVEGESLRDRLNRERHLPVEDALRIATEVADALGYAHRHKVIHRDIKPENILLHEGHATVADFGVARAIEEAEEGRLTETGLAIGTPAYLSPEQASGERELAGTSDIYALGCVLYEMLAGEPPFTGPTVRNIVHQHLAVEPRSLAELRPGVPVDVEAAVSRSLAKAPSDRYQSAEDLAAVLGAAASVISGARVPGVAARWGHPVAVAGWLGVAAAAVLGVVYVLMMRLGLPDWVLAAAAVLLVVILPVTLGVAFVERHRATRTVITPSSGLGGMVHRWLRWRKAVQGSVIGFVGLGVVTGGYMVMRSVGFGPMSTLMAAGLLEEQDRILVADFENRTVDSMLGFTLADALRIDLAQSPVIRVLELEELRDALRRMGREASEPVTLEVARELAEREGVKAIVAGEVGALGEGYALSGRLVDASTGEVLIAERVAASGSQELVQAVDDLSAKLRERLGESLRTVRGTPPLVQVTTSSLEALRAFMQGRRAGSPSDEAEAMPYFEQAIAIDTAFAMGYWTLAVYLVNANRDPARRIELCRKAYAYRDRLTERERYLTDAYYHEFVEGDLEKAIATYRRMLERYPGDPSSPYAILGSRLLRQRKWEEALDVFREGRALLAQGNIGTIPTRGDELYANVAIVQFVLNDSTALDSSLLMLEQLRPDWVLNLRSIFAAARRDYDTAWEAAQRFEEQYPRYPLYPLSRLAGIAHVRGQLALAQEHLDGLSSVYRRGNDHLSLMTVLLRQAIVEARFLDHSEAAVRLIDEAVNRHLDSVTADARGAALLHAAAYYAMLDEDSTAARYLAAYRNEIAEEVRRLQPERHWSTGWVALARGDFEEAIAGFRAFYGECPYGGPCGRYEIAHAFDRMGNVDSALVAFERAITVRWAHGLDWTERLVSEYEWLPVAYRRLGELYEQRGDSENALHYYNEFVELWKNADPVLQPQVDEVRQRITRLVGEPQG